MFLLVRAFQEEKALVGAFSVIVKTDESFAALTIGFKFHSFCYLNIFVAYFVNIANRLLSLGIVLYRCVLVLVVGGVQTPQRRRLLSATIGSILSLALGLTAAAVYYKEAFKRFLSIVQLSSYLHIYSFNSQRVLGACTSSTSSRRISTRLSSMAAATGTCRWDQ